MQNFKLKCTKVNGNNKSSNKIKTDKNTLLIGKQPNKNMWRNGVVFSNMAKGHIFEIVVARKQIMQKFRKLFIISYTRYQGI